MKIEIVYGTSIKQELVTLEVTEGCTIKQAIELSGLLQKFPEIDLTQNITGIFSKKVSHDTVLSHSDRVEIYRPLMIDPKQARRLRAKKSKAVAILNRSK